jgi:hypothetical protein
MLGWKELAQKVDKAYSKLPKNDQTIIITDNYGQAGAINYYSKNKNIKAVSFNADYVNWFQLDRKIDNLIRIKELDGSENEIKETGKFFENSILSDSVANPLAREYKTKIFVFSKSKTDINKRLKAEVEEATDFKSHKE